MDKLVIDNRPRCPASGPQYKDGGSVPCELEEGHKGMHEWNEPFSFFVVRWRKMDASHRRVGPR